MSELSVGQLKGLPINNNVITVPAGQTLYAPGHVVQVVSASFNSDPSTTSGSFVDSGWSISFTPKSADSKILITFNATFSFDGGGQVIGGQVAITDSSNNILTKQRCIFYQDGTGINRAIDTAAALSAHVSVGNADTRTYKVRFQSDTGNPVKFKANAGGPYTPYIVIQEIAA